MPRRVQDIVPGDRRGIRDVPVEKDVKPSESKARAGKKPGAAAPKGKSFDEKRAGPRDPRSIKPASKLEALGKRMLKTKNPLTKSPAAAR